MGGSTLNVGSSTIPWSGGLNCGMVLPTLKCFWKFPHKMSTPRPREIPHKIKKLVAKYNNLSGKPDTQM